MSKEKREYPGDQPFNRSPRYNLTKKRENTWWGHSPFNNNRQQRKEPK